MTQIDWINDNLGPETPVDSRFRRTQNVRRTLTEMCGPTFRFDGEMIRFVDTEQPRTLGEIAEHWRRRKARS